jgi:hypothetical protein
MKKMIVLALMLVPALALAATTTTGTRNGMPYFTASETVKEQGTVIAIDTKLREVTIHTTEGDTVIVTCGPEVKNFAKIAVGDQVNTKYTETLKIHVEETGTPSVSTETNTAQAKQGEQPHASVTDKLTFSATITAIDKAKGTVTLKGYRGNEYELTPRVKENLDKVKVGQLVVFNYEAAVAASVDKVKPAKSSSTTKKK